LKREKHIIDIYINKLHYNYHGAKIFNLTRLECSRRQKVLTGVEKGVPSSEILQVHNQAPFACCYYGVETLILQKTTALASPSRFACRDLFDLHHLLTRAAKLSPSLLATLLKKEAVAKIESFQFRDFREQVLPFLPPDLVDLYRAPNRFEAMKKEVQMRLES